MPVAPSLEQELEPVAPSLEPESMPAVPRKFLIASAVFLIPFAYVTAVLTLQVFNSRALMHGLNIFVVMVSLAFLFLALFLVALLRIILRYHAEIKGILWRIGRKGR
ncbi:MAG: hypothetical protein LBR80_10340 [Deltaproteobacteria bacterium]|nr:hypothetical protein [Deltaproteobacteria bacterium]